VKVDSKKSKAHRQRKTNELLRSVRGKYKHLDLMKGLIEAREKERQIDSKMPHGISAPSLKVLDKSVANLKKGLASAPITEALPNGRRKRHREPLPSRGAIGRSRRNPHQSRGPRQHYRPRE
jgi:hypothetical protein